MLTYTPMIQQYLAVKAEYQDAFLFYRLGDFYEMFFDDALKASKELEITLTSRQGGALEPIPMCGVPHHAAAGYIETLVGRGYKVAICEQVEDPKAVKGIVRREVVQLITPGTVMEGKTLSEKENNFIACIHSLPNGGFGFAYIDLSTGENKVTFFDEGFYEVLNEVSVLGIKEVVLASEPDDLTKKQLSDRGVMVFSIENESETIETYISSLQDIELRKTSGMLLNYIIRTQKRSLDHIQRAEYIESKSYLAMDYYSKRNLELTETIRSKGKKGSLLWLLDETNTAMGGRKLKEWVEKPLLNQTQIEMRQSIVKTFMASYFERENIRAYLNEVYDLERLVGRVAFGNCNAKDLVQLKKSLQQIPMIKQQLVEMKSVSTSDIAASIDPCTEIAELLQYALVDNPPFSIKEGEMIRTGFNEELDKYKDASMNGKNWIAQLELEEKEKTGIRSLKIGYNRIFGYYIEISKANFHLLNDSRYERKQTLANAERYVTPELKEMERVILEAEEKSVELEYRLFIQLRDFIKSNISRLQGLAKIVSEIDCYQCFAKVSEDRKFVKPSISKDRQLVIIEGRHPVVEKVLQTQEYVPNDVYLNDENRILLVTGPNMSGKSTYMRQVAHIVILNQIGCFVPAKDAVLPIFDKIFTRIGAADDLISGQSTFMVEMLEAKNAMVHATPNSLLLFDEIGRGTSTYDGMALAQAIIEHIHEQIGSLTIFSTHYHELTTLDKKLSKMKNIHVRAVEQNGKVVFLHKVVDGPADRSYGIHVAELADMPNSLIKRAKIILKELEKNGKQLVLEQSAGQLSFSDIHNEELHENEESVLKEIRMMSLDDLSPREALDILFTLQSKLK
ncbi:MAG: mutS [Bacillales bacterium]|jgi:DNA mismatch repair protein MutS|nr:mutS [Bacillales bacterium]